jgi:choline dehydrogenase
VCIPTIEISYQTPRDANIISIGFEKFSTDIRDRVLSNKTQKLLDSFPSDWPDENFLGLESSAIPDNITAEDNYLLIGATLYSTAARGNMTISSNDTVDPPVINPNWLGDERDQEMAVASFMRIQEMAFNSSIVESTWEPGPEVKTKEQIIAWLNDNMSLTYHSSGTCKMGTDNDTMAVVDTRSRVRGVTGLRVVDASAFALQPPGYPMSTACKCSQRLSSTATVPTHSVPPFRT